MRGGLLALAVVVILGGATSLLVTSRRNAHEDRMRSDLALDVEQGGLAGLARAQARARHLIVADPADREGVATLAFTSAVLAVEYGFDTAGEVRNILGRDRGSSGESEGAAGMIGAARSLLLLNNGDREGAARVALAAAQAAPGAAHPLYALGRARARAGDLAGAGHALEAADLRAPGFTLAEVAWAEGKLDAGDAQAARAALLKVLARSGSGDDLRARLLLGEAERALGSGGAAEAERPVCAKPRAAGDDKAAPRWPPAAIRAACALALAAEARTHGRRGDALAHAEEAGRLAPAEPRLLARAAQLLAQLGAVDWAAGLLERARHLAAPEAPTLKWAAAALELGRGRTTSLPRGPRPADPETGLIVARAALSAGGVGALRAALDGLGEAAVKRDADLGVLAQLVLDPGGRIPPRGGGSAAAGIDPGDSAGADGDPWRAYLDGLRANLAGDLPEAARHFARALSGHGDACRAAGEYVAALRLLKRPDDPRALTALRAENARCVNLR